MPNGSIGTVLILKNDIKKKHNFVDSAKVMYEKNCKIRTKPAPVLLLL